MRLPFIFFIIFLFSLEIKAQVNSSEHIISVFLEIFPNIKQKIDPRTAYKLCKMVNCPSYYLPSNFGIFATYSGYLNISNENGQIDFPRKTVKDSLNILIVDKILPVFMFRNTIAYWYIPKTSKAQMYKFERKKDLETGITFWKAEKKDVPKNNRVPLHTLILFTNPNNIYVPLGVTPTNSSAQLILPTIYIRNDLNYIQNCLFVLTIKPFFSAINKIFKQRSIGYAKHIT